MPLPFNVFITGNPNPLYDPPPPPPGAISSTILPNSAPTTTTQSFSFGPGGGAKPNPDPVTTTSVQQPAPIDIFSSTPEQIAEYLTAYENWQSSQSLPQSLPNSAPTPTPSSVPASNWITENIQQGMNALFQGEEPPPLTQAPSTWTGQGIFASDSNAFSGILNQLTDISNSNWRDTYDPYGLNPTPLPNTPPTNIKTEPSRADYNYTLVIGAGVGALVLYYFYTKK